MHKYEGKVCQEQLLWKRKGADKNCKFCRDKPRAHANQDYFHSQ